MKRTHDRRRFLQTSALAGVGFWVAGRSQAQPDKTAGGKIRFASVGVGGMGQTNTNHAARHGDVVALCDVDDRMLDKAGAQFNNATKFHDYRKLFDGMHKDIDAVVISTPNHTHAVIAAAAIALR